MRWRDPRRRVGVRPRASVLTMCGPHLSGHSICLLRRPLEVFCRMAGKNYRLFCKSYRSLLGLSRRRKPLLHRSPPFSPARLTRHRRCCKHLEQSVPDRTGGWGARHGLPTCGLFRPHSSGLRTLVHDCMAGDATVFNCAGDVEAELQSDHAGRFWGTSVVCFGDASRLYAVSALS